MSLPCQWAHRSEHETSFYCRLWQPPPFWDFRPAEAARPVPRERTATGGAGGDSGLTKVSVGVIPIVDCAPIYLGDKQGFFKEEGLQLDIQTATGGAAIVPGVVSGSFDFAFSNLISVMVAKDKGLDLKFVANGASTTGEIGKDIGGVVVPAGSSIQSAKDLAGKTVSVNNLSNIGDTTIKSVIEKDGGDPNSVKFVEVAFPDAPAALANKQVDAAWILEPFLSKAVAEGGKIVSSNFVEMQPGAGHRRLLHEGGHHQGQGRAAPEVHPRHEQVARIRAGSTRRKSATSWAPTPRSTRPPAPHDPAALPR